MPTKADEDDQVLEQENADKASTDLTGQKTASKTTPAGELHAGYISEDAYKGLQRTAQKQKERLETELQALQLKLEAATAETEEAKLASLEKTKLEAAQAKLSTDLKTLQEQNTKLTRQLNQQKIVLEKFPQIASLSTYIPPAESDEQFLVNAQNFHTALQSFVNQAMGKKIEGATPPIGGGNQGGNQATIDKLWNAVYAVAGVPGKEKDYEEAYAKLQEAIKSQQ